MKDVGGHWKAAQESPGGGVLCIVFDSGRRKRLYDAASVKNGHLVAESQHGEQIVRDVEQGSAVLAIRFPQ